MVFCNLKIAIICCTDSGCHNPYFNRWFSAIECIIICITDKGVVTILILIDGFLQYNLIDREKNCTIGHNPYFNRWFSAILKRNYWRVQDRCHNPYFNRWFSAI